MTLPRKHFTGSRVVIALCAFLPVLCGCSGKVELTRPASETEPSSCAGRITRRPVVLRSDLSGGELLAGSDYLVLFGSDGDVLRLDRCSGQGQTLASGVLANSSTLAADYAWFSSSPAAESGLFRIYVSGGPVERVTDFPTYDRLFAHGTRLFFTSARSSGSGTEWSVNSLEASETEPTLFSTLVPELGQTSVFSGVGNAGLYFTFDHDCFCTPALSRLPFGETELLPVPGAEGASGGHGGYAVAVAREHLYVRRFPGGQIARLPLAGGEREIVVAGTPGEGMLHFAATEGSVCWMVYETGLEVAARCVELSDPDRAVRELDRFESGRHTSFALGPDAAYWLRPSAESPFYELVAAAL